jgi:hypothetical protein
MANGQLQNHHHTHIVINYIKFSNKADKNTNQSTK